MKRSLLEAVKTNPEALSYESAKKLSLATDKEFMFAAAKRNLAVLKYAAALGSDCDFMKALSKEDVNALQYVSGSLVTDHAFWINALIENEKAIDRLPEALKQSPQFWRALIIKDVTFVQKVPSQLRTSSLFLEAIEDNEKVYPEITNFLEDPYFLARAVGANKKVLNHVGCEPALYQTIISLINGDKALFSELSPALKESRDFKFALIIAIPELVIHFISEDLQFYIDAAVANPLVSKHFSWLMEMDVIHRIVIEAYKKNKGVLEENSLRGDKAFMLKLVAYDVEALKVSDILANNEEFMLDAIKINPQALGYTGPLLQGNTEFLEKARKLIDATRR